MKTYAYGYPRLGAHREYKRLIEGFWKQEVTELQLREGLDRLERERLRTYHQAVDQYPVGEMTFYDSMLDHGLMFGLVSDAVSDGLRVGRSWDAPVNLSAYYRLARGADAWEMTKWFNTNYHYLVPPVSPQVQFRLVWAKPLLARQQYQMGVPYVIGPYTFLTLSKGYSAANWPGLWTQLIPVYAELLLRCRQAGAGFVHVDEPALVGDVPPDHWPLIHQAYQQLGSQAPILLMTYYDTPADWSLFFQLPVRGFGVDLVHGRGSVALNEQTVEELVAALQRQPLRAEQVLIVGVVNGRNVWKTELSVVANYVRQIQRATPAEVWISNAGPLSHLPVSLASEDKIPPALRQRLAFAQERLTELRLLRRLLDGAAAATADEDTLLRQWNDYTPELGSWRNPSVRQRLAALRDKDFSRDVPYESRDVLQRQRLRLPWFPTTTIGSFPQTEEVRRMRNAFKNGRISSDEYHRFIDGQIRHVVQVQEQLGLDVLVHGEFERSDMVEFFAEKLEGIALTQHGWILSYGTRVYRPPIIYGDVARPQPMTVREITFAQSLTQRPMKGMLTGPVTILAWSFARQDLPWHEVAWQLGLALQDEVRDLEAAGISVIQIDEPAFRELAPIQRARWPAYFDWAVKAFRLASRAKPETQIHTHMCYSEFNEILPYIEQLDADVITIEATRSKGEVIQAFERHGYPRQIGPGVYDVHSPAVPPVESIVAIIRRVVQVIPAQRVWVNPDCGLKTRRWEEVLPALRNLVLAAQQLRREFQNGH
ncbi:MAG: 5-methyltetrahydropteroyltriglutamate--homocysteine S-methyltransferase, partial [Gemmatales bacterium]|nr:5-methyltetrahydropteroyltriglutamate--homocysteine S-methyltransferase [Gemmatales bacterium]MDW8175963.1 5-methyltetrahydropteroyltriglutamate--homocysteine S-methyltransferase [Gemmatales bacterium]